MYTPLVASITIVIAVLFVELFLMLALKTINVSYEIIVLLDSFLLVVMLCPFLYFLFYKPLTEQAQMHKQFLGSKNNFREMISCCSQCKKIHSSESDWQSIETYLKDKYETKCLNSICPSCSSDEAA